MKNVARPGNRPTAGMLPFRGYNSISGEMMGPISDDCILNDEAKQDWIDHGALATQYSNNQTKVEIAASLALNLHAAFGLSQPSQGLGQHDTQLYWVGW